VPTPVSTNWLVPGLFAAAVLGLGAFLMLRRRRSVPLDEEAETFVEPAQNDPAPQAPPPAEAPNEPSKPVLPPQTRPSLAEPLAIGTVFAARAVRLSLVYATVQYELEIANESASDLPGLQVRADLTSAHASLGTREQLAPAPEQMEVKHSLGALAPGEAATLKGDVRVSLQQLLPLAKGNARFFVPLVRFAIVAQDGTAVRRVFTIGPRDPASGAITSVRLDAGPRNLRELESREIEAARGFTLDPMIAHS
jgi:hypothetical protein